MTEDQFKQEYKKLASLYPEYKSPFKEEAVAKAVIDLEHRWWASLVSRLLISKYSNGKEISIADAALGERNAMNQIRKTQEMIEADNLRLSKLDPDGLNNTLRKLGANSLLEAIYKQRKLAHEKEN